MLTIAIGSSLLFLALAGWGAFTAWLVSMAARLPSHDLNLYQLGVLGILAVTLIAMAVNVWAPLGNNPGWFAIGAGLALLLVFHKRIVARKADIVVFLVLSVVWASRVKSMRFEYDAGLYHIPFMNWLGQAPLPLGLANLEGRLGFNPSWLIFEAATKVEIGSTWGFLLITENLLRSLAFGFIVVGLYGAWRGGARGKFYIHLYALALAWYCFRKFNYTSTDVAPNIFALIAWLMVVDIFPDANRADAPRPNDDKLLVLTGALALSLTGKVSQLPIALLVLPLLYYRRPTRHGLYASGLLGGVFVGVWCVRNFLATGCLVYPLSLSCFEVPWGVGRPAADAMQALVMAWNRYRGPGGVHDVMDLGWVASWWPYFHDSWLMRTLKAWLALIVVYNIVRFRRQAPNDVRPLLVASILISILGIGLWFWTAPEIRYAFSFWMVFIVSLAALLVRPPLPPPALAAAAAVARHTPALACVGMALLALAVYIVPDSLWLPSRNSPAASYRHAGSVYQPTQDDRCWEALPCSVNASGVRLTRDGARYIFTKE